jgi:hypothetical protein
MERFMKNITSAIDEETLVLGRQYAKKHNMSFNALVRKSLEKTVKKLRWAVTFKNEAYNMTLY